VFFALGGVLLLALSLVLGRITRRIADTPAAGGAT
jgi:uncharacterized membrane protein